MGAVACEITVGYVFATLELVPQEHKGGNQLLLMAVTKTVR